MQELIKIESAPAQLDANFAAVREELERHLEKYETVVTEDGVKDAKAAATEINQLKGQIKTKVKAAVDAVSQPIQDFREQGKQLEDRCEEARQAILTQVRRYEDRTRELARTLLQEARAEKWAELGVDEEHQRAQIDDLVKLTAVTGKGNLAAASGREIRGRCKEDKARQDKVKMRLLELESRSYQAGLAAPLTKDHISQWLETEEEQYEQHLQRILDAEVSRQEQAERKMRERMEREQAQKEQAERERQERQERERQEREEKARQEKQAPEPTPEPEPEPEQAPEPAPEQTGRQPVTVTVTFEPMVKAGTPDEAIEAELRRVMGKAGIKTLTSITVSR